MNIKYLIIHHTAVSREDNSNQFTAVKNYHIGKGWGDIGYHYFIEPNGEVKNGRADHVTGAHTIGHNHDSLGIALAGNFDVELPTPKQEESLRLLLQRLSQEYSVAAKNIVPHRTFANKSCYGNKIDNNWAKDLLGLFDPVLTKKWEGRFIQDIVGGHGEIYYVYKGQRYYISPKMKVEDVARYFANGFKHTDIIKIPEGKYGETI